MSPPRPPSPTNVLYAGTLSYVGFWNALFTSPGIKTPLVFKPPPSILPPLPLTVYDIQFAPASQFIPAPPPPPVVVIADGHGIGVCVTPVGVSRIGKGGASPVRVGVDITIPRPPHPPPNPSGSIDGNPNVHAVTVSFPAPRVAPIPPLPPYAII